MWVSPESALNPLRGNVRNVGLSGNLPSEIRSAALYTRGASKWPASSGLMGDDTQVHLTVRPAGSEGYQGYPPRSPQVVLGQIADDLTGKALRKPAHQGNVKELT